MPTRIKQFGESQTAITFGTFSSTCKFTGLTVYVLVGKEQQEVVSHEILQQQEAAMKDMHWM